MGAAFEVGALARRADDADDIIDDLVGKAHGLRPVDQREGRIDIRLAQELNDVSVVFHDDGAGLDLPRLREKAEAQDTAVDLKRELNSLLTRYPAELKRTRTRSRVMLAASGSLDLDRTLFWPRISHKWKDSTFTSPQDLYLHIARSLNKEPVSSTFPWSLSATCYSLLGPADIKHYLDIWFHPSVQWISRCSIINSDFVDESKIVEYCAVANAIKAGRLSSGS